MCVCLFIIYLFKFNLFIIIEIWGIFFFLGLLIIELEKRVEMFIYIIVLWNLLDWNFIYIFLFLGINVNIFLIL